MYRIAICDDEKLFADRLSVQVTSIMELRNAPFHLDAYNSCDELYAALRHGKRYHMYLLDILMDGIDGMQFARQLRARDEEATIVFITCTQQYIRQGYDVRARQYLEKPVDPEELRGILLQDYENKYQKQYITVRQGSAMCSIAVGQVVCVEVKGRKLLYHLLGETLAVSATEKFDDISEKLPDGFVRCHRSYCINLENVQRVTRTEAIAKNAQIIPISRSRCKAVQRAFAAHVRRNTFFTHSR